MGDASLLLSWRLSSSALLMHVHLSRLGTEKLSFFPIKHVLKMKANYFSWHSTGETDDFQLWRANWVDTALGVGSDLCYFSGSFL